MLLAAASSNHNTLYITIGAICFLLCIVVLIYGVFNPLSRRSRRERGLPRKERRRRRGKHEDREDGKP